MEILQPIRVLHVVTVMNRNGLESRIMDIYRNIDRSKIQFDFLTHRKESGAYDSEIESLGGRVYHLPSISPLHFFSYLKVLDSFFKNHKEYDIVHAHLNSYCTWVLMIAKRNGVRVRIAHSRNSGMDNNWKAIFKYLSKLFVNGPTTHKFACSKQAGEWLFGKKGIIPPNYFKVIPNGFNLNKFKYNEDLRASKRIELGLNKQQIAVVLVGRLTYQKNHKFLFDVFEEILKTKPDAQLFLIGDGELRDELQLLVNKKRIHNNVTFVGNIPNVGDYLQAMDIMIFPSVYEGFGTVVIETQCIGLPTLASDVLPHETKITQCLEFMSPVKDSPRRWASKALDMYNTIERKPRHLEVKTAGYDIEDSYKLLATFYLNLQGI